MTKAILIENSILFGRIVLAGICGVVIGYERRNQNKGAGIRTHAILAVGAALIMVVSKYGFDDTAKYDASRIASQIVSGVGFLGAGLIFVRNDNVSGLTTAAGIWTTAGIGMCVGAGMYMIGVASTILVVLLQIIFHRQSFFNKMTWTQGMIIEIENQKSSVKSVYSMLKKYDPDIIAVKRHLDADNVMQLELSIIFDDFAERQVFLSKMMKNENIYTIEFL